MQPPNGMEDVTAVLFADRKALRSIIGALVADHLGGRVELVFQRHRGGSFHIFAPCPPDRIVIVASADDVPKETES